jgi:hypothetical protein
MIANTTITEESFSVFTQAQSANEHVLSTYVDSYVLSLPQGHALTVSYSAEGVQ